MSDMLMEVNALNHEQCKKSTIKYSNITFSKYVPQKSCIISCINDIKNNNHELIIYSRDFVKLKQRRFSSMITLSVVNAKDIICYTTNSYIVLDHQLEVIDEFTKALDHIELGPKRFLTLSDSSERFYYFKSIDESTEEVFIKVHHFIEYYKYFRFLYVLFDLIKGCS